MTPAPATSPPLNLRSMVPLPEQSRGGTELVTRNLFHHMPVRESGGRSSRQPGQVRKEAATTISLRVVPAPTFRHPGPFDFAQDRLEPGPALLSAKLRKAGGCRIKSGMTTVA